MDKTTNKKPAISTQSLVTMAIFAAILSVSAYASIPIPLPSNPHITLLNFVILLVALLFPLEQSFLVILVWMLLGILGVPVFIAGGSGFGYIIGPYGGSLLLQLYFNSSEVRNITVSVTRQQLLSEYL